MNRCLRVAGVVVVASLLAASSARAGESATASPAADYNATYAGAVFRPQFCLHNCTQADRWQNRYLLTYGVEVGGRYFGVGFRYGQERRVSAADGLVRNVHEVSPDLRVFYSWRLGPVLLTPFFEVDPMILFGAASGVHLIVRPGFRATVFLAKFMDLAIEPFALDIDWYRWERYGSHSKVDWSTALRYSVSISLHARW